MEDWQELGSKYEVVLIGDGSGINKEGAWTVVIVDNRSSEISVMTGGLTLTTINVMELMPYVHALAWLERENKLPERVLVMSDSKYVVSCGNGTAQSKKNAAFWAAMDYYRQRLQIDFVLFPRNSTVELAFCDRLSGILRRRFVQFNGELSSIGVDQVITAVEDEPADEIPFVPGDQNEVPEEPEGLDSLGFQASMRVEQNNDMSKVNESAVWAYNYLTEWHSRHEDDDLDLLIVPKEDVADYLLATVTWFLANCGFAAPVKWTKRPKVIKDMQCDRLHDAGYIFARTLVDDLCVKNDILMPAVLAGLLFSEEQELHEKLKLALANGTAKAELDKMTAKYWSLKSNDQDSWMKELFDGFPEWEGSDEEKEGGPEQPPPDIDI